MKIIVAVLASTFLISGAYAQSPAPSAGTPPPSNASAAAMTKADAKRDAKVEMHINDLHAKLKITAAEETQWAAVVKAMHDNASELDKAIDKREASMAAATAVDDLNAYADIAQAHADSVKKLATAFAPLYAAMPDDQKKVADKVFAQHAHEGKHMHHAMK
ncbi:MAG: Spy/CpxP family protein refolding chaperone [Burkholderiales bacterium]